MLDSWLPPWLQPVVDSVRSAADPFADWLRSQGPANDVPPGPSPSPGYDAAVAGVAPWESRPVPDLGGMAKDALRSAADAGGYPEPRATIGTEPVDAPVTQPGQYAGPPNEPMSSVEDGMRDVTSAQDASARSAAAGPVTQPGQDAGPPNEPTAAIAWRPPFAGPVGYMPPPVTPGPDGPMPAGSTFDQSGDYAEPRATIEPDPMDTAGGFDAKVDEYAGDPELLLRAQMDRKAALEAMAAKSAKEQAEKEKADLERSIQIREQARAKALADRAQIEQDARSLADGTPFGNWWASRSTGQKVSNYIAAIFGGLMQGSTGGRNSAIDLMMKAADDDANQKWKSLEMRRQMSGEALNDADAEYKFKETQRAASRQQMIAALEAQMAGFDPQGKAAQDAGAAIGALRAADEAARQKGIADAQKQWLEAYKADSERMQAEAQMKNALSLEAQRAAKARGAGGGGGAGAAGATAGWGLKDTHDSKEWADRFGLTDDERKTLPAGEMTGKGWKDWLDTQQKLGNMRAEDARKANQRLEYDNKKRALYIGFDGQPLYVYNPDGSVQRDQYGDPVQILANTEAEGKEMREQIKNSVAAIRLLYEAKAIRDRANAGDVKMPWTTANQQLKGIRDKIVIRLKAGTQGMSSDSDMNKIAQAAGVADLLSLLNQDAALDQGIRMLKDGLNSDLHEQFNYNGPSIDVPNPHAGNAPKKNETADVLSGKGDTSESVGESIKRGVRETFSDHPQRLILSLGQSGKESKMSGEQKAQLAAADAHLDTPNHPDQEADAAGLAAAAVNGAEPAARKAAAVTLWKYVRAGNPAAVRAFHDLSKDQVYAFMSLLPAKESWDATFGAATSGDPATLAEAAP